MQENFFENWVEEDLSPFMTFSSNGKLLYSNSQAQFLLSRVETKQIYELCMNYAPATYGYKTSYIDLGLDNYKFYAVTVGYQDEDVIGIKLYKSIATKNENIFKNKGDIANIFTIVDLAISSSKIKSRADYTKNYDPSIPEFKISVNDFLKLINTIYKSLGNSKMIDTTIRLKIGEYIKTHEKKYPLVLIAISYDSKESQAINKEFIENLSVNAGTMVNFFNQKIELNLPLIVE